MLVLLTHSPARAPAPLQAGIPQQTVIMQRESSLIFSGLWSLAGRFSNSAGPLLRAWSISGWAQVDSSSCCGVFCSCVRDSLWTNCFCLNSFLVYDCVFTQSQTALKQYWQFSVHCDCTTCLLSTSVYLLLCPDLLLNTSLFPTSQSLNEMSWNCFNSNAENMEHLFFAWPCQIP